MFVVNANSVDPDHRHRSVASDHGLFAKYPLRGFRLKTVKNRYPSRPESLTRESLKSSSTEWCSRF